MKTRKALRLFVAVLLVVAMSVTMMSCKKDDPTPTPSETVKPTETAKPSETVKPSETATPTEEPTPTPSETAGLLNDDFWNWYGGNNGGSDNPSTDEIEYTAIASLTGDGTYKVKAIETEEATLSISNASFSGKLLFKGINAANTDVTINTPKATVQLDVDSTVKSLSVTSGENTFILNAKLNVTEKLSVNGGNVELNGNVVNEAGENAPVVIESGANTQKVAVNAPAKIENNKADVEIAVKASGVQLEVNADTTVNTSESTNNVEVVSKSSGTTITEVVASVGDSKIEFSSEVAEEEQNVKTKTDTYTYDYIVSSNDELLALASKLVNGQKTVIGLKSGATYSTYGTTDFHGKTVEFVAIGNDKITWNFGATSAPYPGGSDGGGSGDYSLENADVTFVGIKFHDNGGNGNYKGFVRCANMTFDSCDFDTRLTYWGVGKIVAKNCTFTNANDYLITASTGTSYEFENCTFNSPSGKYINAYKDDTSAVPVTMTFESCKFESSASSPRSAVYIKSYKNVAWVLEFNNCDVTGCKEYTSASQDVETGSPYFSVRGTNEAGTADGGTVVPVGTKVTVDGTVLWENGAKK